MEVIGGVIGVVFIHYTFEGLDKLQLRNERYHLAAILIWNLTRKHENLKKITGSFAALSLCVSFDRAICLTSYTYLPSAAVSIILAI